MAKVFMDYGKLNVLCESNDKIFTVLLNVSCTRTYIFFLCKYFKKCHLKIVQYFLKLVCAKL